MKKKPGKNEKDSEKQNELPEDLNYPPGEDIYSQEEKLPYTEEDGPLAKGEERETKSIADDLDIPGTELDDEDEAIGEEDEENNYYSLGGDNHNDLEEDNGE